MRAILALEARLPSELVSLKNLLGVMVYDNLRPKEDSPRPTDKEDRPSSP